jgi:hypothetical protein
MRRVVFHRWTIEVDPEATAAAYSQLAQGAAPECGCMDCRNWIEQRETALPSSFLDLLSSIGIDFQKETEISEYEGGGLDPKLNLYAGEFLFHGRLEGGPDCFEETGDGKGAIHKLYPVIGDLKMGFSSNTRWAMGSATLPELFPRESCSVLVFQTHAPRGPLYG